MVLPSDTGLRFLSGQPLISYIYINARNIGRFRNSFYTLLVDRALGRFRLFDIHRLHIDQNRLL